MVVVVTLFFPRQGRQLRESRASLGRHTSRTELARHTSRTSLSSRQPSRAELTSRLPSRSDLKTREAQTSREKSDEAGAHFWPEAKQVLTKDKEIQNKKDKIQVSRFFVFILYGLCMVAASADLVALIRQVWQLN